MLPDQLQSQQIILNGKINGPNIINVAIIFFQEVGKGFTRLAFINKIAIIDIIESLFLQKGDNGQLVNVRRKIYHTGTTGGTFCRIFLVEYRGY